MREGMAEKVERIRTLLADFRSPRVDLTPLARREDGRRPARRSEGSNARRAEKRD